MGRGRAPCCDKTKVKKGPWSPAEDLRLTNFIQNHGHSNWRALPKQAGLLRCGKSCRLRWINYLRPDVKRGNFTSQEEQTIINLHNSIGNKWSKIASYLPGRTDNEIKNVWNTHLKKRLKNKGTTDQCGNKNDQAKPNYSISASPSCTSVSSITSSPNPNTENALIVHQEPGKPNKDVVSVHSPTSSHHTSNFSNSNETSSEFAKSEVINEEEKVEIPLESDTDFWELFDSLGTNQEPRDATNNNIPREEKIGDENECSKWFRLLENELGLTCDDGNMANDVQDIVPTTMEMDLEPETGPELDYFPIWPSSPQNLGI